MTDPISEACRRVRDQIVQRSGGFEGYFNQLEELDRKRLAAEGAKRKTAKESRLASRPRVRKQSA